VALRDPHILERTLDPLEKEVLADFVARARRGFGDRLVDIVLFGSRARGDVDEDSDIDLLLVLRIPELAETDAADAVWDMVRAAKRERGSGGSAGSAGHSRRAPRRASPTAQPTRERSGLRGNRAVSQEEIDRFLRAGGWVT
jgi:hypothetical protein